MTALYDVQRFSMTADLSWLLGHLVSGLVASSVAEIVGRKRALMLDCIVFAAGFALYAFGANFWCLSIGRALLGYPLVSTVSVKKQPRVSHFLIRTYKKFISNGSTFGAL